MNVTINENLPAPTAMVKTILMDVVPLWKLRHGVEIEIDEDEVLRAKEAYDQEGPYLMAQRLGLLVNNSGEDMAIEFMSYVNSIFPHSY